MVHFNDVLEVTASILIESSGGNLSDLLVFRGTGKVFLNRGVFLLTVLAHYNNRNSTANGIIMPRANALGNYTT